ncbi:MAG: NAD(P)/FAD-dependent oxidoreductase, partial [Sphaerochaeta sp.]
NYPYTNFTGNSIRNSQVDFFHAGETKRYLSDKGDLLFTHDGLSGPVILNNSRLIKKGDRIHASLLGTTNKETLYKHLGDLFTQNAKKQLYTLLKGEGLFGNLAQEVLASQFLSTTDTCANLSKERRVNLVKALADQEFIVSSKKGFNAAMVTAGGVALEEIDRKSMESKLVKGLFFTGEVMDIDGDSGGYNLQSAFSTAKLMAQHIQGSKP